MKILIVGGTGHVGSFLCEILKARGHEVVIACRGTTKKIPDGYKSIVFDSSDKNSLIKLSNENFDTIIDFPGTAYNIYSKLKESTKHIIACGSLWMLGLPKTVPTPEIKVSKCVFEEYETRILEIGEMLQSKDCIVSAILPPNIAGPGKIPVDGLGGRDIDVHKAHKNGEIVYLPDGADALISPCDAYDIAMLFALCAENPEKSAGQMFNVGSGNSMTITELIKLYSKIYKTDIPISYVSWEKYKNEISPSIEYWWHFYAHMCPDITKAKEYLGYKPKYSSEESIERAVIWMRESNLI